MDKKQNILKVILLSTPLVIAGCNEGGGDEGGNSTPPPSQQDQNVNNGNNSNNSNNSNNTDSGNNVNKPDYSTINKNGVSVITSNKSYFKATETEKDLTDIVDTSEEKVTQDYTSKVNLTYTNPTTNNVKLKDVSSVADFEKHINKNIEEKESTYIRSADRGSFSRQYVNSVINKIAQPTIKKEGKDYITQVQNHNNEPELIYNSGFKDTSNKWTKEEVDKRFEWDRLERDRIVDITNIHKNGLIGDADKLADLVRDDVAKVMVVDTSILGTLNLDYNKITATHYIEEGVGTNGIKKDSENVNHGDAILYQLMGKPYDTNFSNTYLGENYDIDWHKKGAQYFYPGFLYKNGKVAFIGQQKDDNGGISHAASITSDAAYDLFKKGYKILNMSYSHSMPIEGINGDKDKRANETFFEYLKRKGRGGSEASYGWYEVLAKNYDVLFVNALGNEYDKKISLTAFDPLFYKDVKKDDTLINSYLAVAALDPTTGKKADYSNSCSEFKEYCITAVGQFVAQYNQDYAKKWGIDPKNPFSEGYYHTGTSLATPYVASTAALVKSVFPWMTNYNLQQTLLTTAKDLGEKGVDSTYGWGLVQPQLAVGGPAQFYKNDFVVNFEHDKDYLKYGQVFRFSNDISGNKGLTIKGNDKHSVLSLSGNNTYTGNTTLKDGAIVNIDGINNKSKTIIESGHLFGSGLLGNVYNNDNLHNYSYFAETKPSDLRSQYGMVINGDYQQTEKGILNVYLGQPLLVKGYASLDGTLNVEGIKTAYVSKYGKIFEDVLVSQKGIAGKFNSLITPQLFENAKLTYNTQNLKDQSRVYTVSLFTEYSGLKDNKAFWINLLGNQDYNYLIQSANNFDNLNDSINNNIDNNVSNNNSSTIVDGDIFVNVDRTSLDNYVEKLSKSSGLTQLMANIQNSDVKAIRETLSQFSGKDFNNGLSKGKEIVALSQFNTLNEKDGLNYKYQSLKDGYYSHLSLNVNDDDLKYGFSYNQGQTEKDNDETKFSGFNLKAEKQINDFFMKGIIGYNHFTHKLDRDINLFDVNYQFKNANFKQDNLYTSLLGGYTFKFEDQYIKPYLGYTFEHDRIKSYVENYDNFEFSLEKQHLNNHYAMLGIGYGVNLKGFDIELNYLYKKQLNNAKNIVGSFNDEIIKQKIDFLNSKNEQHLASLDISKKFDNLNIGLNSTYQKTKNEKDNFIYGLKIGYQF